MARSKHRRGSANKRQNTNAAPQADASQVDPLPMITDIPQFNFSKNNDTGPALPDQTSQDSKDSSRKRDRSVSSDSEVGVDENDDRKASEVKRQRTESSIEETGAEEEWTTVSYKPKHDITHKHKKGKKKDKGYPAFDISPQKLRGQIKISDLQMLALNILADGIAPNWLLIRNKPAIKRVVFLYVPGLTLDLFKDAESNVKETSTQPEHHKKPDVYERDRLLFTDHQPLDLSKISLSNNLQPLSDIFSHVFAIRAGGEYTKVHSPIQSILQVHVPKDETRSLQRNKPERLKITELFMSIDQMLDYEYPLHSSQVSMAGLGAKSAIEKDDDWRETDLSVGKVVDNEARSILQGRTVYAMDCEMVTTTKGIEIARVTIVDWDGEVVLDKFVKPEGDVTDYLTKFSGITPELLSKVTRTLADIHKDFSTLFTASTVLVGQSLNSDLVALHYAHPFIIDTSCIYEHPRGPPNKPGLKWLSQKYLHREIQQSTSGHDSVEDARACLSLLKLKIDKGAHFGLATAPQETIFTRLSSTKPNARTGGVVDYGDPARRWGSSAEITIPVTNDEDVITGVLTCVNGNVLNGVKPVDFTWAHFTTLYNARGFNTPYQQFCHNLASEPFSATSPAPVIPPPSTPPSKEALDAAISVAVGQIQTVYDGLPKCTALIVYGGTGNPIEMGRLNAVQAVYKREFKVKKWDECSVKWTDVEEQALRRAVQEARMGMAMMVVK